MDVDNIEPGMDFVKTIEEAVASCDVLIAVIGTRWLVSSDEYRRRLDNPQDFVRLEIATALKRDIRVIPVLVEDVAMPSSSELPDDLKPLARRHALELSHTRFNADADRLVEAIESALQQAKVEQGAIARRRGATTVPPAQSSDAANEFRIEEMRERPALERKEQDEVPPLRAGPRPAPTEVHGTPKGQARAVSKPIIVAASIVGVVLALIFTNVLWFLQQRKPAPVISTPPGSGSRNAKLGEELSANHWIFQVRSVREADGYDERYYQAQIFVFRQIVVVCDQCVRICGFEFHLQPIEIQKQGSQVAVTTGFSEMGWEMTETIEVLLRDALLAFGPAPVGQALVAILEPQMVVSPNDWSCWVSQRRQPLKQRTVEERITPLPDGYKCG
jgi:hypothetical protein